MFIGLCLSTVLLVAQPTGGIVYENPEILTQDVSQNEISVQDTSESSFDSSVSDNLLPEDTQMDGQGVLLPDGFTDSLLKNLDVIAKLLFSIMVLNILLVGYGLANITLKHFKR